MSKKGRCVVSHQCAAGSSSKRNGRIMGESAQGASASSVGEGGEERRSDSILQSLGCTHRRCGEKRRQLAHSVAASYLPGGGAGRGGHTTQRMRAQGKRGGQASGKLRLEKGTVTLHRRRDRGKLTRSVQPPEQRLEARLQGAAVGRGRVEWPLHRSRPPAPTAFARLLRALWVCMCVLVCLCGAVCDCIVGVRELTRGAP